MKKKTKKKTNIKKKKKPDGLANLVVLMLRENVLYLRVVAVEEARKHRRLGIDLEKGTWDVGNGDVAIGKGAPPIGFGNPNDVIGVYDRRNTDHLSRMASDAIRAVTKPK